MKTKASSIANPPRPEQPLNAAGYLERAKAARAQGNHEAAIGHLLEAIKAFPDSGPAHAELGAAFLAFPDSGPAHAELGAAFLGLAMLDQAETHLKRAAELMPDRSAPWINLGTLARRRRNWADARACYQKAVEIEPAAPEAWRALYRLQKSRRDVKGALASLDRLIALNSDDLLLAEKAALLQATGDAKGAERVYATLLANRPLSGSVVEAWVGLLSGQERYEELLARLRVLAAELPNDAVIAGCLGTAYTHAGDYDQAYAALIRSHGLDPASSKTLHDLGVVTRTMGRIAESKEWFAKCLSIDPFNASALRVLGTEHKYAYGDEAFRRLNIAAARSEEYAEKGRVQLHYALGKAYEDVNEIDVAFAHYVSAGRLQKKMTPHSDRHLIALLKLMRVRLKPEHFADAAALGHPSDKPVFVLGMPRSGTSLIEQIISSHPAAFGAGELKLASKVLANLNVASVRILQSDKSQIEQGGREPSLFERGAQYVAELEKLAGSGDYRRIVDKMPGNYVWTGLLHMILPQAKIIHSRRHPVETCLSCFRIYFPDGQNFTYDLKDLGRAYRLYHEYMRYWHEVLPAGIILDVRYEDVVSDTESQARRIISHLGLEWNDACLNFHETDRPVRTASASQVRKPIYKTSVGRWRKYEPYLKPLLDELGPLVAQYEAEIARDYPAADQ